MNEPREGIDYEIRNGQVIWYCLCPTSCSPESVCKCISCTESRIRRKHGIRSPFDRLAR